MKRLIQIFAVVVITTLLFSCKKSDPAPAADPTITFKAVLNGSSEATANPSTASGNATLVFDDYTKKFTVTTTYSGLTATLAHIHKGAVGVSGPVIFGFTDIASPIVYSSIALDATQEADLKANLYYVNVHSSTYPGGEIRGQLIRQ